MAKATSEELNLRRAGDGEGRCQLCSNWGAEGKCKLLGIETIPQMVCDGYASVETAEADPALPAEGGAPQVSDEELMKLFGG